MKLFYSLLTILTVVTTSAQSGQYSNYFQGKDFVCSNDDKEVKELMQLGIDCFQIPKYYNAATNLFLKVIKKDSTYCDAYFLAGYSLRLQNKLQDATLMYYIADSIAPVKSQIFKQNLATTALMAGAIKLARKKFNELVEHFPESPEGYYGIAFSALEIKDYEYGLENIDIAISKYSKQDNSAHAQFIKGVLLTVTGKYSEAIPYLTDIKGNLKKDDTYNASLAICLYNEGTKSNDVKLLKQAQKAKLRIKDKSHLMPDLSSRLTF